MQNVPMNRSEAELLVDLLMDSNHHEARNISEQIRKVFGMISEDLERATLEQIRTLKMTGNRITDFEAVAPMPVYTQADLDAAVAKALASQKVEMPRKESLPIREYLDWISKGKTLEQIAEATGRSVSSVYEALKRRGLPTCARHYLLWKASGGRYD